MGETPMSRRRISLFTAILVFAILILARPAAAHPEGFSGLAVDIEPTFVKASLTLYTRDLNAWFPPRMYPNYVADVCRELQKQGPELLDIRLNYVTVPPSKVTAGQLETGKLRVELFFPMPTDEFVSLKIENRTFDKLPRGHIEAISVEDRRHLPAGSKSPGRSLLNETLELDSPMAVLEPVPAALPPQTEATAAPADDFSTSSHAKGFFTAGVKHILTGYDHLLFVAALLLACRTLREAITIITFFTVAHSITLTLASLNLVRLGSEIVEPAIAGTILFVAVENLIHRPNLRIRCMITFGFGLIHGLGFATDLREMFANATLSQIIWPLVKFSAGVETGHLTLVALALPILLYLKQKPVFDRRWVPACSIAISLVGAFWLITRIADSLGHPIDPFRVFS